MDLPGNSRFEPINDGPAAPSMTGVAARLRGRSLGQYADGQRDNILVLRLIAALLVVLGHSVLVGGGTWPHDPVRALLPQAQAHLVGLVMFFMISGFLITLSFERRPYLLRFLRARALRLLPALIACVLAWAFVLGPLLTQVQVQEYFNPARSDSPYRYAWAAISLYGPVHQALPGMFEHNPVNAAINGPLWTIRIEAALYLWVAGAGTLRLLRFRWASSFAITAVFCWLVVFPMMAGRFDTNESLPTVVQGFFGAGVVACLLRRHIPISTGLMIVLGALCIASRNTIHALPVIWLTVGYFTLWFAYVPRLPDVLRGTDLSYGIYLWAWPVQQAVASSAIVREPILLFLIVTPILLVIGLLSWSFIEKPALRLKDARLRPAPGGSAPVSAER